MSRRDKRSNPYPCALPRQASLDGISHGRGSMSQRETFFVCSYDMHHHSIHNMPLIRAVELQAVSTFQVLHEVPYNV